MTRKHLTDAKSLIQCIAKDFNVPYQTLNGHLNGCIVHNQGHELLMHLTINEEKELVHWITIHTQCGYAP